MPNDEYKLNLDVLERFVCNSSALDIGQQMAAIKALKAHFGAVPVAYAYEYEEFNDQWMRGVIMATEGGSDRLCAPPKTHDSKPVRNVRPLYAR